MKTWLTCSLAVLMLGVFAWSSGGTVGAVQSNPPVQMVRPGQKQVGNPGEKGATYYGLETQTTRMTTRFRDGHVAITDRGRIGDVTTTLRDGGGNEVARLTVNRVDGRHDLVHYEPTAGAPFQAMSDPNVVKPTLDWSAKQAYHLIKGGSDSLIWDQGMMRSSRKVKIDVEAEVTEVETEWADGLIATMSRQLYEKRQLAPGRFVGGSVLVSSLSQNGTQVGKAVWFEKDRAFMYHIPQLMPTGATVIFESDLVPLYGGWPFKPDTTWINLQLIGTHHMKTLLLKNGTISVAKNCIEPATKTRMSRLTEFFMPTVLANEPGCDSLHHLDGGVVRDCCDNHDRCYAKNGCTSTSWWRWWTSWDCTECNVEAVWCFFTMGQLDPNCINFKACAG